MYVITSYVNLSKVQIDTNANIAILEEQGYEIVDIKINVVNEKTAMITIIYKEKTKKEQAYPINYCLTDCGKDTYTVTIPTPPIQIGD